MMRRIKRSCMILLVLFCVGCSGENTGQTLEKPAEESVSATAARATEATQTIEMPDDGESAVPEEIRDVLEKNPSVVGWITIEDTNIDYPIAWNPGDNEYFLYRDIDGNESESGSIYLDSHHQMEERGLHVIYGHHRKNGTMFHDIVNYRDPEYLKTHQEIFLYTGEGVILLEPVHCYAARADGDYRKVLESAAELEEFFMEKSGVSIQSDQVFVFITCSYDSEDERTYLITRAQLQ